MIIRHWGIRGCVIISVLFLCLFSADVTLLAQPAVKSNGTIILNLSLSKLDSSRMIDSLSIPVYLTGNLSDAYRYEITEYLLSKHKQVSSHPSNTSRLNLQVTTSNQYQEVDNNDAVRNIAGNLTVTLTDTAGIIKGMAEYSFAQTDTVPSGLREQLQTEKWKPSLFIGRKKRRGWMIHKVLEPGLLLGAIGVTVYLLFNVRGS